MSQRRSNKAAWITTLMVALVLAGAVITSSFLRWLGDWEVHGWGLSLAERIVWGCCLVAALAVILTRVTIFGWNFRRYFRWTGDGEVPRETLPIRPVRAPWVKSGATSFSITVVLVSLTGAAVIAWAVLWMLEGVIGSGVYWWVTFIVFTVWWVLCIAAVLTRIAIFGKQKKRAIETNHANSNGKNVSHEQPSGVQEQPRPS